ncbi:hypothetical protein ACOSQ3_005476 [Xanthoceras sorbifolium]
MRAHRRSNWPRYRLLLRVFRLLLLLLQLRSSRRDSRSRLLLLNSFSGVPLSKRQCFLLVAAGSISRFVFVFFCLLWLSSVEDVNKKDNWLS